MLQTVYVRGKRKLGLQLNRLQRGSFNEKVCFLHLPKCGGSSIHDALQNVASASVHLDPIASKKAAEVSGTMLMTYREQLLHYFMALPDIQYIGGHFRWSDAVYEEYGHQWNFITVLRHPVDKWFSQYFYNRYKESGHFKLEVDLETYLASNAGQRLGSGMVNKLIDSAHTSDPIRQAIRNLDKFELVGVLEHIDQFYYDFHKRFGAKLYTLHERRNPASELQREAKRDPEIRRRVEEVCQPDLELYHHALQKLKLA